MSIEDQLRRSRQQQAARMQASEPVKTAARDDRLLSKAEKYSVTSGCLVQAIGAGLLFLGFGILYAVPIGIGLIIWGGIMARRWRCQRCKNPIAGKDVRLCPSCGARMK